MLGIQESPEELLEPAKELDRKLCIKNAGDLLNQYVGGTEQRIAAALLLLL